MLKDPQRIQPIIPTLKAGARPPIEVIIIATKTGPSPLPKSSKVLKSANAWPRVFGKVVFCNVAFTIGPVTPLPTPASTEVDIVYSTGLPASTVFISTHIGTQPSIAATPERRFGYRGSILYRKLPPIPPNNIPRKFPNPNTRIVNVAPSTDIPRSSER
eukprot:CAMPEP_0183305364 /NCGR_PEP_ID=MMETSP0160_2-20130417/10128_1 /TAXON_ID=2839 ORGANISM="Odontella Sinensis, Strain Grunow 1884" /NCGR_SAMPLE_ID=MMETSP0160_2 /ASSEMBLY_ACC=CAM_ASM_000250 /LENGTH=158 /DNA_ID=CAMNT_0025468551 /DNA_START=139 /DNA_END=615 /DNA_ORIENTATION=+